MPTQEFTPVRILSWVLLTRQCLWELLNQTTLHMVMIVGANLFHVKEQRPEDMKPIWFFMVFLGPNLMLDK